jgi:O-antigen/teichoic acid export membrane protein
MSGDPTAHGWLGLVRSATHDRVLKKGALSVVDQGVVSATGFLTSVTVGRVGSPEGLGVFYLALSLFFVVCGIQTALTTAPFSVYLQRREPAERATYAGSVLAHHLALTGLSLAGLAVVGGLLAAAAGPADLRRAIWVLMAVSPALLLREFVRRYCFAQLRPGSAIGADLFVAVLQLGGLAGLVVFGHVRAATVYRVMGGACAIGVLGWWWKNAPAIRMLPDRIRDDWHTNWAFGRWALVSQTVGFTAPYVVPWILALDRGEAETGILAAGLTIVGLVNLVIIGSTQSLGPSAAEAFAREGVEGLRSAVRRTAIALTLVTGSFFVTVALVGEWLIVRVYGNPYAGNAHVVVLLAGYMVANGLSIVAGNGLWAMDRPALNVRADVASVLATLVSALPLVHVLGVTGAALAMFVGKAVGSVVRWSILARAMARVASRRAAKVC